MYCILLLSSVSIVLHPAFVCKSVMHRELLLQLLDLSGQSLKEKLWILVDVDNGLVADLHHASGKL